MDKNLNKKSDSKNYVFSFLYCIGTILIVAGHCRNGGINLFFDFFPIYSFHLGLFMFCSGYFYKDKCEENFKEYFFKKLKRFIIPMYIWNFVYGIFVLLIRRRGFTIGQNITLYNLIIAPLVDGHQFQYNMCLWYLPSLFLIEISTCLVRKIVKKKLRINEYIFFIIYLFLGMLGVYLSNNGINKEWNLLLVRFLYFLPFFGLGLLYNRKLENKDNLKNTIYFSILLIIVLIIIFSNNGTVKYTPSWCNDFSDNLILPFIIGFIGIAFWLRIAKIVEPISKKSKLVDTIQSNVLAISTHQFLGFFILKYIFAICSKFIFTFNDFNWNKFKTDIWYYYIPINKTQFLILYLIAGIVIPIYINKILKIIKEKVIQESKKYG